MFEHDKLEIHPREREGITILDLEGHLVMGEADAALRTAVQALFAHGNRKLILNMAEVSRIDTSGTGALLFLSQEYREAGGRLVLFRLGHTHGELYEMARLEAALEIYGEEIDAVNSFFPERAIQHYDILDFIERREEQAGQEKGK
jgi:anti-sigma B factor antagonist